MTSPARGGEPPCPVCAAMPAPGPQWRLQHELFACAACGLLYSGRVADPDLARYYRENEEGFFDRAYFDDSADVEAHPEYANYRDALTRLKAALGNAESRPSLLDVGCGTGALLRAAARQGFQAEGLEVSERVASLAAVSGVKVHRYEGDIEQLPEIGIFDAIALWDVLEHLARPVEALAVLRTKLKPGGALLLRTINEDCLLSQVSLAMANLGVDAAARRMHEVYHVIYFTRRTLDLCLERAGFTPQERWLGEFPVERVTRNPLVRLALRGAYAAQAVLKMPYEQYAIARPR